MARPCSRVRVSPGASGESVQKRRAARSCDTDCRIFVHCLPHLLALSCSCEWSPSRTFPRARVTVRQWCLHRSLFRARRKRQEAAKAVLERALRLFAPRSEWGAQANRRSSGAPPAVPCVSLPGQWWSVGPARFSGRCTVAASGRSDKRALARKENHCSSRFSISQLALALCHLVPLIRFGAGSQAGNWLADPRQATRLPDGFTSSGPTDSNDSKLSQRHERQLQCGRWKPHTTSLSNDDKFAKMVRQRGEARWIQDRIRTMGLTRVSQG